ncbi:MAG: hypothetical protein KC505_04595 [Myxococcales bacterium]|nr:hypothetical protein [Myxococcales bacterium]USN50988.1 MAG: hypothetical protein H6731_00815 [Myxococcales bacterium]
MRTVTPANMHDKEGSKRVLAGIKLRIPPAELDFWRQRVQLIIIQVISKSFKPQYNYNN